MPESGSEKRTVPYGRRKQDKCPHMEDHHASFHFYTGWWSLNSHLLVNYFLVSAAISVLVLTFHIWRAMKLMNHHTTQVEVLTMEQNRLLSELRVDMNANSAKLLLSLKDNKKGK